MVGREIKKIEDRSRRNETFSRRRQGFFKKARELTTECGGEVAIISFSLAGNMFAFGHPSVDSVVRRFENTAEDDRVNTENVIAEDEETENVVEEDEEEEEMSVEDMAVDDRVDTVTEDNEETENVVEEEEEEGDDEDDTSAEEVDGKMVVMKEEELAELDKLEAVAVDMLKEVSRIAKRMIEKINVNSLTLGRRLGL